MSSPSPQPKRPLKLRSKLSLHSPIPPTSSSPNRQHFPIGRETCLRHPAPHLDQLAAQRWDNHRPAGSLAGNSVAPLTIDGRHADADSMVHARPSASSVTPSCSCVTVRALVAGFGLPLTASAIRPNPMPGPANGHSAPCLAWPTAPSIPVFFNRSHPASADRTLGISSTY